MSALTSPRELHISVYNKNRQLYMKPAYASG